MSGSSYIGRFAPTPSGPLHFGSVVAALGSYLDAKSNRGKWLLRIEDIDTPRIAPGAIDAIKTDLQRLGLYWDGEVTLQNRQTEFYQAALERLQEKKLIYPCICTRKQVKGKPYPGTCRTLTETGERHAMRIRTTDRALGFEDLIQGTQQFHLNTISGDFIVKRSDGLFAYHLASVVDDTLEGVTHIVRGADLIDATACQIHIQQCLGHDTPVYCHLPVALNRRGKKLSKQNGAQDAFEGNAEQQLLIKGLTFLGQSPAPELNGAACDEILQWAVDHWDLKNVPRQQEITTDQA